MTVYSPAFAGATAEEFAGVPALSATLGTNRMFRIEVTIGREGSMPPCRWGGEREALRRSM